MTYGTVPRKKRDREVQPLVEAQLPARLKQDALDAKYTGRPVPQADLPAHLTPAALATTYAGKTNIYAALAKNPDNLVSGAVTVDSNNLVTSAAVVWPDGTPGTLTITSRDASNAVLAYTISYGSPVTNTYTQPTITRNSSGAAINVPQIVVS